MLARQQIENDNYEYWLKRAVSYSEVNKEELVGIQRQTWKELLDKEILKHFEIEPDKRGNIHILDIGAGPGFLSIILAELGYCVTAADFAETMLIEAHNNAGHLANKISFRRENAMDLSMEDDSFDVVISRNLTWNLPDPKEAYKEWLRVLKKDGLMMVFDANWYAYLRDDSKMEEYLKDREAVKENGLDDYNIGENFDVMEDIAQTLPLTGVIRPAWDKEFFEHMKVREVICAENIGEEVYSEKEKVNYASTPMFMVKVKK
jgi:ubiquinone/menaquinone biosynthesis C-methylase UbiE